MLILYITHMMPGKPGIFKKLRYTITTPGAEKNEKEEPQLQALIIIIGLVESVGMQSK